jgi:transcriptional regulator with XRE-family HTH domain
MKLTTFNQLEDKEALEQIRIDNFGPPPTNPFKRLRGNLTLEALANRIGVSKQALIRLEQGTFNEPLPNVLSFWVTERGYSELSLTDEYTEYQRLVRARHWHYFGPILHAEFNVETHPFRQLRHNVKVNPSEVAKALCIPQGTLNHFEKKWRTQQTVPKLLVDVLQIIGYPYEDVLLFCSTYKIWRQNNLNGTVVEGAA